MHDMYIDDLGFRFDRAVADGIDIGVFEWRMGINGKVRLPIPGTLWTWEVSISFKEAQEVGLKWMHATNDREGCGSEEVADENREYAKTSWMKSTYMSADPAAAGQFVMDVLGAEYMLAPYPNPPVEGCTSASWTVLPESGFMFHFVNNPAFQAKPSSISNFASQVEGQRDIQSGKFDAFMHDSLALSVPSLAPYVERLNKRSQPFYLMEDAVAGEYALFMDVPGNGLTIQLRSPEVGTEVPISQSVCSQTFKSL